MHPKFLQKQICEHPHYLRPKERNISLMILRKYPHGIDSLSPYFYLKIPLRFSKKM